LRSRAALLAALLAAVPMASANRASAQARVVAFPTHADDSARKADIDRALLSALQARDGIELAPAPALDLEAFQLAIDCAGTNASCLREVAERTHGEVLLAPRLERRSQYIELRILYFSAQDGTTRYAAHKELSRRPSSETLKAIPAMLAELFAGGEPVAEPAPEVVPEELPAPETQPEPAAETASSALDDQPTASDGRAPVAPLVVVGGGALLVGAGIVLGVVAKGTEDDYAKQPVSSVAEAEAASSLRDRGRRQALIANVLIGAGAAVVAAGGVWLLLSVGKVGDAGHATVAPDVGPDHAALSVSGRWSGL
jgi:hypothetical protein